MGASHGGSVFESLDGGAAEVARFFDIVDLMKGHVGDGVCVLGASGSMA